MSGNSNLADSPQLSKFRMSPEDKALYERIATLEDPTSVTRAEKNQLTGVPPPDEEDRICKAKTGLTMAELENKVMTSSDTLSEEEVNIILFGVMWEPGKQSVNCKRNLLWSMNLVDEEQQLVAKVQDFLANDYDNEIHRLVYNRNRALDTVIKQRREQQRVAMTTRHAASRSRWVQELITAKLPQWGFVVFRTDYSEETDEQWHVFKGIYTMTGNTVLKDSWKRASPLIVTSQSIFVSDPVMDGVDTDALRQRFKKMRERQEIPNGIAMDCFLVVDKEVLNHNLISSKTLYKPKSLGDPNPWEFALYLRAVDPDYNDPETITPQADTSDFTGEITIPLPKVFDWLYYCSMSKSEDWETRYLTTKGGPAELMSPEMPYPAYRSGKEQLLT